MHASIEQAVVVVHQQRNDITKPCYSVHMDAFRALAAFIVLAGHARMLFFGEHVRAETATRHAQVATNLGIGHHAVIVFFVLSGFLVGNSAWRAIRSGRWSWRKYLLQRMTRLWLVLLPALLIGGCLDHVGSQYFSGGNSIYTGPGGQGMVDRHLAERATAKVLIGNALFLQKILVPNYGTNAALWSLANEFWYYVLFPTLLLVFIGGGSIWARTAYAGLAASIFVFVSASIAALFVVWLVGFAVSILPLSITRRYQSAAITVVAAQFVAVGTFIRMHPIGVLLTDVLLSMSFGLLLYCVVHVRQPMRNLGYSQLATKFASFSYTLYLMHLPCLTFLTAVFITPWHAWPKDGLHLLAAASLVCGTYAYAWCFYLLFERNTDRVRIWIVGWSRRRRGGGQPASLINLTVRQSATIEAVWQNKGETDEIARA